MPSVSRKRGMNTALSSDVATGLLQVDHARSAEHFGDEPATALRPSSHQHGILTRAFPRKKCRCRISEET